ncbi:MAG: HAD hydrolase-like protein [Desulfofustis sp.]|nr:HAD hydrolase-like protein [Desulfofustis sp.]
MNYPNISSHTYYTINQLVAAGRSMASAYQTVSFDLFDTLLIRRIHDPDLVKRPVARYISALASQGKRKISWQTVQKIRDETEKAQRLETGRTYEDQEACYPVFMEQTLRGILGSDYTDDLLNKVTNYELHMESSMLIPRAPLLELVKELHLQGKRLFVISDVYLPAIHLKILLDRAGILPYFEDVISSADTFLAKASGRAFPLVQKKFQIDEKTWLHIGDNPISDGLRPVESGITSLVLKDSDEKFRKALIKRYHNYSKGRPFYRGRALQQLMLPLEAENIERQDLYREGFNFFGPMIGAFVHYLADECRRLGLTKVFFFSREGYTFKKVWDIITPVLFPDGDLPHTEYLYVSRMALAGASCAHHGLSSTSLNIALLPPGNKNFYDIARIFQLDLDGLHQHLKNHKLAADSVLSPLHEGYDQKFTLRLRELLEDQHLQDEIRLQTKDTNKALHRYLTDVGFFDHQQVAVADIGWLGTIQRFLYDCVKHRFDCPRIHGYVLGATRGIPFENVLKNSLTGVIYDRHRLDLGASAILYARDLFEEACRAPHPTIDSYLLKNDGYELKFRTKGDATGRAELEQDQYYNPLQQGIFDAAKAYGSAAALLGYSMEDFRPWFNYLLTAKLAFPKSSEIVTMRHRHHLDDFHGTAKPRREKIKGPVPLWERGEFSLKFQPLLRTRLYWKHIRTVMNS